MTDDFDFDAPDAYADVPECHARKPAPVVIGVRPHIHVCREFVNEQGHQQTPHQCICGAQW